MQNLKFDQKCSFKAHDAKRDSYQCMNIIGNQNFINKHNKYDYKLLLFLVMKKCGNK